MLHRCGNHLIGKFKIMMINMLKALKTKVGNIQDQVNNFIRETKNQMKMQKVKSTVTKLKDEFNQLISILSHCQERIH